jgi:hypothetical protein
MKGVFQVSSVKGDGGIDHYSPRPTFERFILRVHVKVSEDFHKTLLQNVFCIVPIVRVAYAYGKEHRSVLLVQHFLVHAFIAFAPVNDFCKLCHSHALSEHEYSVKVKRVARDPLETQNVLRNENGLRGDRFQLNQILRKS